MKHRHNFSIILFIGFLFGCKTPPVTSLNEINFSKGDAGAKLKPSQGKLKIYFPEFYHEDGSVIGGDGIVILLPDSKSIVIDGFMPEAAPQYIDFIKSLGITKIDHLMATHFHTDHVGTFPKLVEAFEIGQFYSNGAPANNSSSASILKLVEEKNIPHEILKAGSKVSFSNDCYFDILWPSLTEEEKYDIYYNPGKTAALINLSSIVTKMHYKDFTIIFPGDIYKKGDAELSKKYGSELKADILKAPHHGEWYTANNFKFISNVSPDYAIIQDNRYITRVISSLYKMAGSKILYRLTPGYILIESDGLKYEISEVSF